MTSKAADWRESSADTSGVKAPPAIEKARLEANASAIDLVAIFRLTGSFDDRTWTLVEAVIAELLYKCQICVIPSGGGRWVTA